MIKTKKMKRALSFVTAAAVAFCLAPTVAFAGNTVNISELTYNEGTVTVKGSINNGAELTMLAVRSESENIQITDFSTTQELEQAIMYIDQVTANTDNFEKEWSFELRNSGATGDWITIFMGGTDASVETRTISIKELSASGTAALATYTDDRTTFVAGTQEPALVLTGDAAWIAQLSVTVKDADDAVVTSSFDSETGVIDMAAPDVVTEYTVTVENTSADYNDFSEEFTFNYVSAAGYALAQLPANLGVTVDSETDETKYTITVPYDTDDIAYSVTVDGNAQDISERRFDVDRDEENDIAVAVTATLTSNAEVSRAYTVNVVKAGGSTAVVTADDVTIIKANPYGISGKTLIAVNVGTDVLDPVTASMTIGEDKLYYSPVKQKFYGVVNSSSVENAAENITIDTATASETLYFGVTVERPGKTAQAAQDFSNALKKYLKKPVDLSEKQFIAMDVAASELDGTYNAKDFSELLKLYLKKSTDLPVNAQ